MGRKILTEKEKCLLTTVLHGSGSATASVFLFCTDGQRLPLPEFLFFGADCAGGRHARLICADRTVADTRRNWHLLRRHCTYCHWSGGARLWHQQLPDSRERPDQGPHTHRVWHLISDWRVPLFPVCAGCAVCRAVLPRRTHDRDCANCRAQFSAYAVLLHIVVPIAAKHAVWTADERQRCGRHHRRCGDAGLGFRQVWPAKSCLGCYCCECSH